MEILYDYQIFEQQEYGGISRYYTELMSRMKNHPDIKYKLPIRNSSNYYLSEIPEVKGRLKGGSDYYTDFFGGIEFPGKWRLYRYRNKWFPGYTNKNQKYSVQQIKSTSFDLFHPTALDDYFLKHIGDRPFVVTIHDMIDEYFPEYAFHVHSTYRTSVKERMVQKAAGIIAVSNSTKHDILERFDVDEKKIKVIYHGASKMEAFSGPPLISGDYFLYVGKRVHYKNFYFFLQAIQPFLVKFPALKIACVGAPFNDLERSYLCDLRIESNVVHVSANDHLLGNLYQHAKAFVYPSLYEGFGIPILEAFQCNCPIMVSNTSSLPEVAGNAALYFNPKDIGSIQEAFNTLLTNDVIRKDLIAKGTEQLKKFSWEQTAEQTFDFYRSLVK